MAKNILLIDDEFDIVAVTKARLESAGYKVIVVETAEEGFIFLQKDTPDLILLDLLLPKMQGEEVCVRLKADLNLKAIPVILFTASACDVPKVAEEIGADDYILKPYEPEELLKKIRKFIG